MLTDVVWDNPDTVTVLLATMDGADTPMTPVRLAAGFYTGMLNLDNRLPGRLNFKAEWPTLDGLECCTVVDTPQQFIDRFRLQLELDSRDLIALFWNVKKNPENKGQGGGWRWHKWGEYIGDGNPQYEYLDDEEGFEDGVWTCHVYDVSDIPHGRID